LFCLRKVRDFDCFARLVQDEVLRDQGIPTLDELSAARVGAPCLAIERGEALFEAARPLDAAPDAHDKSVSQTLVAQLFLSEWRSFHKQIAAGEATAAAVDVGGGGGVAAAAVAVAAERTRWFGDFC
jgi:hypothetical protein